MWQQSTGVCDSVLRPGLFLIKVYLLTLSSGLSGKFFEFVKPISSAAVTSYCPRRPVAHRVTVLSLPYIWSLPTAVPVFPQVVHCFVCTVSHCSLLFEGVGRICSSPPARTHAHTHTHVTSDRHAALSTSRCCRCQSRHFILTAP